jgi:hypothetical protein
MRQLLEKVCPKEKSDKTCQAKKSAKKTLWRGSMSKMWG